MTSESARESLLFSASGSGLRASGVHSGRLRLLGSLLLGAGPGVGGGNATARATEWLRRLQDDEVTSRGA